MHRHAYSKRPTHAATTGKDGQSWNTPHDASTDTGRIGPFLEFVSDVPATAGTEYTPLRCVSVAIWKAEGLRHSQMTV